MLSISLFCSLLLQSRRVVERFSARAVFGDQLTKDPEGSLVGALSRRALHYSDFLRVTQSTASERSLTCSREGTLVENS